PALGRISKLRYEWMNGIQFFLKKDVPIHKSHSLYFDSPWALTSISQKQFWPSVDLAKYGDGTIQGVLSVDISNWNTPGILYKRPAKECTPDEIKEEVLAQIGSRIDPASAKALKENVVRYFLDPSITFPKARQAANSAPLLINTIGSWKNRPTAETAIRNLF